MRSCFNLVIVAVFFCAFPTAEAAEKFAPARKQGEVVLFDAAEYDFSLIRNYTASWQKGSDLTPVVTPVVKGGQRFAEFSYRGRQGSALSTFWYKDIPESGEEMEYCGIRFTIDYDNNDYAKVSTKASFTDGTSVTAPLTLEPGCKAYVFRRGFRRAKTPIRWGTLSYLWLSARADGAGSSLKFRLKRITMDTKPCDDLENRVVDFSGDADAPDLFGRRLFNPRLKQVRRLKGAFKARRHGALTLDRAASERTCKTAELFVEQYYAHTGIRLTKTTSESSPPSDGIVLRVAGTALFNGKPASARKEGYCLTVETDRILVTGFDEPGLYYGTVTFFQLMKNSMKIKEAMPVPCVEILDWPDLPNRLVSAQGTGAFKNQTPKDDFGIEYMMEWTDRFVAGQKANVLFWDLSTRVRYRRRPEFNGSERIYTLDDLRRFGDFCRDRFVEVCPAWQIGGHANWWLLGYHPELREKGYRTQADVTHPDHNKIVFDCMLDVIEALGCRYASPKSDEWWGPRKTGESPDPLLNGKTRAQAFLDFHVELNMWLKSKGVTMLMYHDMLCPYHNGKKFDIYKVAERFPRNVVIQYWGGYDIEKGIRFFGERGFPVWIHSTGSFIRVGEKEKKFVSGAGKILYSFGNDKVGGLLDEYSDFNNMYASFRLLDYAWNFSGYKVLEPGRAVALRNIMAVKPNCFAGEKVEPIDISTQLTHSFNAFLKRARPKDYADTAAAVALEPGTREIGFIPMKLGGAGKGNCIVLRKNDRAVSLPVRAAYSSLVFLHTAFINNPKDPGAKAVMGRYWIYGWPCGEYVVHYADGEKIVLPVRLTMNIRRFDTQTRNRGTNENRHVYALKDVNKKSVHLFQWEWVNPRPDKVIDRIIVQHDNELNVSLVLMAVSGRSVWKPDRSHH